MNRIVFAILIATVASVTGLAQGTFRNLDFESAKIPVVPAGQLGGPVSPEDGLPGWTVYAAGLGHNVVPTGGGAVVIFGPEWAGSEILQGGYSAGIFASATGTGFAIGESGRIPQDAKSLRFYGGRNGISMAVTFGGTALPLVDLGATDRYRTYGVDISAYAGQTAELRFTAIPVAPNFVGGGVIDNIQFSPVAIPEPATITLFLGGLGVFGLRFFRRKRQPQ